MAMPQSRTLLFVLPHTSGLEVVAELVKSGQEAPEWGDRISLKATMILPIGKGCRLHPELDFGSRIKLTQVKWDRGDRVEHYPEIGYLSHSTHPRVSSEFRATTWAEAFEQAEVWVKNQVKILVDALETRHQALMDADRE